MSFLSPAWFTTAMIGLAAISLPIIIHYLFRNRYRVVRSDTIQEGLQQAAKYQGPREPRDQPRQHQPHTSANHEAKHVGLRCAEGETKPEFVSTQPRQIRQESMTPS